MVFNSNINKAPDLQTYEGVNVGNLVIYDYKPPVWVEMGIEVNTVDSDIEIGQEVRLELNSPDWMDWKNPNQFDLKILNKLDNSFPMVQGKIVKDVNYIFPVVIQIKQSTLIDGNSRKMGLDSEKIKLRRAAMNNLDRLRGSMFIRGHVQNLTDRGARGLLTHPKTITKTASLTPADTNGLLNLIGQAQIAMSDLTTPDYSDIIVLIGLNAWSQFNGVNLGTTVTSMSIVEDALRGIKIIPTVYLKNEMIICDRRAITLKKKTEDITELPIDLVDNGTNEIYAIKLVTNTVHVWEPVVFYYPDIITPVLKTSKIRNEIKKV